MIRINQDLRPEDLQRKARRVWEHSASKIWSLDADEKSASATPVFTSGGKYTSRGWTEWTQGFAYGSALLQFDATGEESFLRLGRDRTLERMAQQLTNAGGHDHGFNNVSTYGNLWRLMREGRLEGNERERQLYELALKCSGAGQAMRWTHLANGEGYIHSFHGPHSLFASTMRSLRALALSHHLGHAGMGERDEQISLLRRLVEHARTTAKWAVFYHTNRDVYDVRGRVAQESVFNVNDGTYRCASSQQGYSPFTTWTRGLAWVLCGFSEQLEWIATLGNPELERVGGREAVEAVMLNAAKATGDFYLANTPLDGVPYWDTGAPGLAKMGNYLERIADPFNEHEPVDSSAAAIAAQGLLRLGHYLRKRGQNDEAGRYWHGGLTIADTLFSEAYLSTDPNHQGILLHSVYHRPNGWDYIPPGRKVPCGESTMWGDYHARELALYVGRVLDGGVYLTFFGPAESPSTAAKS